MLDKSNAVKALQLWLFVNGALDLGTSLLSGHPAVMQTLGFAPLLGANSGAMERDYVRLFAMSFGIHGAVRIAAGANIRNTAVRVLALVSYVAEFLMVVQIRDKMDVRWLARACVLELCRARGRRGNAWKLGCKDGATDAFGLDFWPCMKTAIDGERCSLPRELRSLLSLCWFPLLWLPFPGLREKTTRKGPSAWVPVFAFVRFGASCLACTPQNEQPSTTWLCLEAASKMGTTREGSPSRRS